MKDEEMAEEYTAKNGFGSDCNNLTSYDANKEIEQAFLVGLKAGRTQWHDLEKDPNDLPNEPTEKMRVNETWVYVKFFDNTYGLVDKGALKNYSGAIAWCELPTFDKEIE